MNGIWRREDLEVTANVLETDIRLRNFDIITEDAQYKDRWRLSSVGDEIDYVSD